MAKVLLLYSTTDGHTREISERLRSVIEQHADTVTMLAIEDEAQVTASDFDKLVIGASIRHGRHSRNVYRFVKARRAILDSRPNAFFSVDLISRKPDKNRPDNNPNLQKFLRRTGWKPRRLAVFAGKLNYPIYCFRDRLLIRLIMFITNGPTDPSKVVEFTDWEQVAAFGAAVGQMDGSSELRGAA